MGIKYCIYIIFCRTPVANICLCLNHSTRTDVCQHKKRTNFRNMCLHFNIRYVMIKEINFRDYMRRFGIILGGMSICHTARLVINSEKF